MQAFFRHDEPLAMRRAAKVITFARVASQVSSNAKVRLTTACAFNASGSDSILDSPANTPAMYSSNGKSRVTFSLTERTLDGSLDCGLRMTDAGLAVNGSDSAFSACMR